ncbi:MULTISPECIES: PH domain-containing protein [unclassified Cellulophaga]|uniref:PH domain-containing protein n=1 Tax=unclassified Cellulophaga TaxID=2634405 RepID=UPI0026E15813|nr:MULTISPECIES: PH domain-containing protein [unclassified Cellulophaga]MDO6491699.1 PH domain-containing protein [Cellulophaga sp. 2_MG-2023]MDO6495646.1 PH domain-containing protein [Cellulophaga sp. 3_MG-2023]
MDLKKFLNESQDPKTVEKVLGKIGELLTKDEIVEYVAVQKKPAVNLSPDSIALTSKRIIFCRPKSFGLSMNFQDLLWKEIADCHMKEGILGATFTVKKLKGGGIISLDYLPKSQARLLYRYAQEREEEMDEYRRQRELENSRARAGGGIIVNTPNSGNNQKPDVNHDPVTNLKKLKQLLEQELISQQEFDDKKAQILSKM